jgi:hypothetical protein
MSPVTTSASLRPFAPADFILYLEPSVFRLDLLHHLVLIHYQASAYQQPVSRLLGCGPLGVGSTKNVLNTGANHGDL